MDELDQWRAARQTETDLTVSVRNAAGINHDAAAETERLAADTGMPASVVESDPEFARRKKIVDQIEQGGILRDSPEVAKFYADPVNARVGLDDIDNLSKIEQGGRGFRDTLSNIGDTLFNAARYSLPANIEKGVAAFKLDRAQRLETMPVRAGARDYADKVMAPKAAELRKQAAALIGIADSTYAEGADMRQPQENVGIGPIESTIVGAAESIGQQPQILLAGLPVVGWFGAALTSMPMMAVSSRGAALNQAQKTTMSEADQLNYSTGAMLSETIPEMIPFVSFVKDLKIGSPIVKSLVKFGAGEVVGEQVSMLGNKVNDYAYLPENKDKTVADFARELPKDALDTLVSTIIQVGAQGGLLAGIEKLSRSGKGTDYQQAKFDEILDAATNSKLRPRDAARFQTFLQSAIGDQPVYVDSTALTAALDAGVVLPDSITSRIDPVQGDVAIPMRDVLATPEIATALRESIRLTPAGQTRGEQKAGIDAEVGDILERSATVAEEQKKIDTLIDGLVAQTVATGRQTEGEARKILSLLVDKARVNAAENNLEVSDVLASFGLTVAKEGEVVQTPAAATAPSVTLPQPTLEAPGIKITETVQVAETGETVEVEQEAEVVYRQAVKRREMVDKIARCLRG